MNDVPVSRPDLNEDKIYSYYKNATSGNTAELLWQHDGIVEVEFENGAKATYTINQFENNFNPVVSENLDGD